VRIFRDFDWLLLISVLLLCVIGLMLIYSVFHPYQGAVPEKNHYLYLKKQILWLAIALIAMIVGFAVHFRFFETLAYVIYCMCILLLFAVMLFGKGAQANRWLSLGPVQIQPSEFTKVALLFVWARVLCGHKKEPENFRNLLLVLAFFLLPFILVLKEPDLGTAIVLFVLMMAALYWRGFSGLHIFMLLSPLISVVLSIYGDPRVADSSWPLGIYLVAIFGVAYWRRALIFEAVAVISANIAVCLAYPLVWTHLKVYQQARILNFLNPEADKLGNGWQVLQSKIAIGSGGLAGRGFLAGTQKALNFIPARHTDFIFSVLGEEIGFAGALIVLALFSVVIIRAVSIAAKSKSEFASTVCACIAVYFFFHVFINVAMTTGIAPVTGIPLPFLSYGGSSLVVSMFLVGFLLNCSGRWYEY